MPAQVRRPSTFGPHYAPSVPDPLRSFKPSPRPASRRAPGPRIVPLGDGARDAAIRALARQARAFPELAPDALDFELVARVEAGAPPMRPLDAAFAHAVYHAAVRRWLTLAFLLNREVRQGFDALEPRVRAVLLAGAAQIVFLDRVPAHAVINHAVEWVKRVVRPGAGGLVNAVLRRVASVRDGCTNEPGGWRGHRDALPLSAGGVLRSGAFDLPEEPVDRLAVATSHPRSLLEHWLARMPEAAVRDLALHGLTDPPVILNTEHAGADGLAALGDSLEAHNDPLHRVYRDHGSPLTGLLESNPQVWVQDPSSAGAIRSIADMRPRRIIDLCAGRGTKTRQLASAFPNAEIIATDVDVARFARLKSAFGGSDQVSVLPLAEAKRRAMMSSDLVLLDVPCSNTGVLPRRPEARYRFGPATLESLTAVQRQLIADSIPLLNREPGSRPAILYATCSLEGAENEQQAAWVRHWHRFDASRERRVLPAGAPGGPAAAYHDGAYSVLLRPG